MKELRPHQSEAVKKLWTGSILCGGVGSGKSFTAVIYFFENVCQGKGYDVKYPIDLYIITTAKKRDSLDWDRECLEVGISRERENSVGGIGLTIDSWNNIGKYVDVKKAFFIFDEQRVIGSGAWVKAFYKITANNRWILLSATPADTWMDYIPVFVANGFYKNKTEFITRHVVFSRFTKFQKVERYTDVPRMEHFRDEILVEMPYEKHTVRHLEHVLVDYDKELFDLVRKKRWNPYKDRPIREVGEYFHVMRKVVNTAESRLTALERIYTRSKRIIVFYSFNYELEALRGLFGRLEATVAEWNGQKHESIPETDSWVYLVQYTAGAEGWNCVTTDTVIFYSLNYSYRVLEQAMGRIDRLNTPFVDLYYYQLESKAPIDLAILKALKLKKSFNSRAWSTKLGWVDPD